MRKLTLILAAVLAGSPAVSVAEPLNSLLGGHSVTVGDGATQGKIFYKDGTRLEFPNGLFNLKLNFLVQSRYNYTDVDNGTERQVRDRSSFEMDRARLDLQGSFANDEFRFRIENDFAGPKNDTGFLGLPLADDAGSRQSQLIDAWIEWNLCDYDSKLRAGQFRTPFSRQFMSYEGTRQFPDNSEVTRYFQVGNDVGAWFQTNLGFLNVTTSLTNGDSINSRSRSEGINRTGIDPDIRWTLMLDSSTDNFGDRTIEGDVMDTADLAFTGGVGITTEQGELANAHTNTLRLGGDLGMKVAGFSAQGEVFYKRTSINQVQDDTFKDVGFYVQSGYFFIPKEWEVAGRYGYIDLDGINDIQKYKEYSLVLGRYFEGHTLKVQSAVIWKQYDEVAKDDDLTDFRYDLQVSGYF